MASLSTQTRRRLSIKEPRSITLQLSKVYNIILEDFSRDFFNKILEDYKRKIRQDTVDSLIEREFSNFKLILGKRLTEVDLIRLAQRIKTISRNKFNKTIPQGELINISILDVGMEAFIDQFVDELISRIKTISDNYIKDVKIEVEKAHRTGLRVEQLAKNLQNKLGISKNNAIRLARDQVITLNSKMTRTRMINVGIEEAIWTTSKDDRVRKLHAVLEGKKFNLLIGIPGIGFPGEPIMCRCTSYPII